ncbi:MAG: GNAT family N-acetyltransferase [Actinomycetota bacterium]
MQESPEPAVRFRPLTDDDFEMLVDWFADPAIARWWNQPAEIDAVRAKYLPRIEGREPTEMWVPEVDAVAAGLFQCYRHEDHNEHDAAVGVPDAVGIDYLVNADHRGRGIGRQIIAAFAHHALDRYPDTTACAATPAQGNQASWRALAHAGFVREGECQPPDEPTAFVYVLRRTAVSS